MFELKGKRLKYGADLLDNGVAANTGIPQSDVYQDTVTYLKQKVFQLERKLLRVQYLAYHDGLTGLAVNCGLLARLIHRYKRDIEPVIVFARVERPSA